MRLDARDVLPSGMEDYLSINGWHFSKKMCDWAVSRMYRKGEDSSEEFIKPLEKEYVDDILKRYNITLSNNKGHDYLFVANMAKADYFGRTITDEYHLGLFIKDYIDDPDGYEGLPFTRFYADCIGSGTPIIWEDMI